MGETALAPYAASSDTSRGRVHRESGPQYRSEFQRDRDRIVHCGAFRRLEYKTQVFVNHEGDMFRTRLTHSIEVAQIGRSIARTLGLNEDLTEAISLAHDLGHTPFGHAGQDALNECMREYGGFEHNVQSLRVVDSLEERYAEFSGLNLTFETREGILKHCTPEVAGRLGELGRRFFDNRQSTLEAQVANIADAIAYNNHDVDDGLRARLLALEQLEEVTLLRSQIRAVRDGYPGLDDRRVIHEVIRRVINQQVVDLIEHSRTLIEQARPADIEGVRALGRPLIGFSEGMHAQHTELKRFLRQNLYSHYRVHRMMSKAQQMMRELFDAFMGDTRLLPPELQRKVVEGEGRGGDAGRARVICDYIAGMTDRYAIIEHRKLFSPEELT